MAGALDDHFDAFGTVLLATVQTSVNHDGIRIGLRDLVPVLYSGADNIRTCGLWLPTHQQAECLRCNLRDDVALVVVIVIALLQLAHVNAGNKALVALAGVYIRIHKGCQDEHGGSSGWSGGNLVA